MRFGTLYGIGVGPGDPELITVKAARILSSCRYVFLPKSEIGSGSASLRIAGDHLAAGVEVHEIAFPLTRNECERARRWDEAADRIIARLKGGRDVCFLTLGDPFLYSTYIYLIHALRKRKDDIQVITVPGITAFSAAAALAEFPLGKGKKPVTIVPAADDLTAVRQYLGMGGTVVLMKIGRRLPDILRALEEANAIDRAVFVARAGQGGQRIETDLRKLREECPERGNLSVILVHPSEEVTG
jgi:precorrin-2/cobalt-factor-2 C20-methyltransferase